MYNVKDQRSYPSSKATYESEEATKLRLRVGVVTTHAKEVASTLKALAYGVREKEEAQRRGKGTRKDNIVLVNLINHVYHG
jgi:hypothetical protein